MLSFLLGTVDDWSYRVANAIDKLLVPLLIIGCSVGLIYAVVIGIKMMKADDKNAREENKQRLINIAISIVAVVVLIALFYALRAWLLTDNKQGSDIADNLFGDKAKPDGEKAYIGGSLLNTFKLVGQCTRMMF